MLRRILRLAPTRVCSLPYLVGLALPYPSDRMAGRLRNVGEVVYIPRAPAGMRCVTSNRHVRNRTEEPMHGGYGWQSAWSNQTWLSDEGRTKEINFSGLSRMIWRAMDGSPGSR